MATIKIAVLASGRGSNFKAVIDAVNNFEIDGEIKVLITDNPKAGAIEYANTAAIPIEMINFNEFESREAGDRKIKELLDSYEVDIVVLAGYMRILRAKELLDAYKYKIINIHPALLPAFKGSIRAQKDAFEYGCKVSGLTIHFVNDDVDGGPIIYQQAVDISSCSTAEEVAETILREEHKAYKKIIDSFSKGRYLIEGKKVIYVSNPNLND